MYKVSGSKITEYTGGFADYSPYDKKIVKIRPGSSTDVKNCIGSDTEDMNGLKK